MKKYFLGFLFSASVVWFALSALLYLLIGEAIVEDFTRNSGLNSPPFAWYAALYLIVSEIVIIIFLIKKLK